jgi:hypothetical protein
MRDSAVPITCVAGLPSHDGARRRDIRRAAVGAAADGQYASRCARIARCVCCDAESRAAIEFGVHRSMRAASMRDPGRQTVNRWLQHGAACGA